MFWRRSRYVIAQWRRQRRRLSPIIQRTMILASLLIVLLLLWPYWTVWRLYDVAVHGTPDDLIAHVDFAAVKYHIRQRLNKDTPSQIGIVSDAFVQWLEQSLRDDGSTALDKQVNTHWLYTLLTSAQPAQQGFLTTIRAAHWQVPHGFLVRIARPHASDVSLLLQPHRRGWQVVAVYY